MNQLDHIVIAADNLEQGVEFIRNKLGVDIPAGGVHQTMGTHNHLMQLGNQAYLELIAINPEAETPKWPRWFGLDQALMRESLRQQPRLITWVMNCENIQRLAQQAGIDIGVPTSLSRNQLRWEIALSDDGRLLGDGLMPYCIQWHSKPHPSGAMADLGCRLESLHIRHNRADWLREKLASIDAGHLVKVESIADNETPSLAATILRPDGERVILSSI